MTLASLAIQLLNGLASASALFLVAAGLTLIFGVTRIVNFAHGSFFMLGAYLAYSLGGAWASQIGSAVGFWGGALAAALGIGLLGASIEVLLLRRLYGAPELLQLTATFGVVLIVRDAVLAFWGPEDLLGPRAPGFTGTLEILGRAVPQYDLFLIAVGPLVLVALTWLVTGTRFGIVVRAASENRVLTGALGIDQAKLYTAVFALGAFLAGLAGALQLPREPANLGMDLATVADAFVITVVGGLGSIPGAFLAALLIGMAKALCIAVGTVSIGATTLAFPKLTLVAEFIVMAIVLALRPQGLLGKPQQAPAAVTPLGKRRERVVAPSRREGWIAIAIVVAFALLPVFGDDYTLVLAIDILIATLFAASLQFLTGVGGMTTFGHAAYFGVGAYAAALAVKHGAPFLASMALAPLAAAAAAIVFGWFCVRLAGVYLAMLTLAFAQITWSIAFQWDSVTGGSNGIVGVWPGDAFADRRVFFALTLVVVAIACVALAAIADAPFGRSLRGARDSALRAEAIGIDVVKRRWQGFVLAGGFAGIAGALFAFSKGSISPETLAIPRSIDVLVMVLLGGLNVTFGPLMGAASFTWLQDGLARTTDYWRALVGAGILTLVLAFPYGIGGLLTRRARRP